MRNRAARDVLQLRSCASEAQGHAGNGRWRHEAPLAAGKVSREVFRSKAKIAVTDQVIYVEHYAASGKTFSRNEQYRDQRFWRAENTDNWSGVSVKRPDRTMVGTIRMDKGGQRVEYTEKVYSGGKLEVTIVSVCRPIRTTAGPQTPSPGEKPQPQTRCQVTDPTGTPLNVRAAPNGHIIGTLGNGDLVRLIRTERDGGGRAWSLIERLNDSQASGWVFRQYLVCTQSAEKPQPAALPEPQRQTWPPARTRTAAANVASP